MTQIREGAGMNVECIHLASSTTIYWALDGDLDLI